MTSPTKVTVIGAGNVGATCAQAVAFGDYVNEVVLLDIKEGIAEGKALDIYQCSAIVGFDTYVRGVTNDYSATAGSDVVVVTAGRPRSPGMSRDDLININAGIVKAVVSEIAKYSPNAILIIVSNPLDTMAYHALKVTGFDEKRVLGMAGILDTARYRAFLAMELGCSPKDLGAILMGGHGDTMVPLPRFTTLNGTPITEYLTKEKLNQIIERTKFGGGELTKLIGTSAWVAPGYAAAQMVEAIIKDQKRLFPCSVYLNGEYGLKDIYIGVPILLGRKGVEKIVELPLNEEEIAALKTSEAAVRKMIRVLYPDN